MIKERKKKEIKRRVYGCVCQGFVLSVPGLPKVRREKSFCMPVDVFNFGL